MENKLYFDNHYERFNDAGELIFSSIYVSDIPFSEDGFRALPWNLYDKSNDYFLQSLNFEWDMSHTEYFKAIISEDFYEYEDLLFKVVYEILKLYPSAKLWIEYDWLYTLEDLEKIASRPYDNSWCYKNPKSL